MAEQETYVMRLRCSACGRLCKMSALGQGCKKCGNPQHEVTYVTKEEAEEHAVNDAQ